MFFYYPEFWLKPLIQDSEKGPSQIDTSLYLVLSHTSTKIIPLTREDKGLHFHRP